MDKPEPHGRNDEHTFDYSQITEQIYVGSDFCTGRECTFHADEFKKLGVCLEINLAAEKKETPPDDIDMYAWLPVVDGDAPSPDQLRIGTTLIHEAVENGNIIYVHCRNGHGRSPTLVAAYLIRYKEMSVAEAMSLVMEKRPETHFETTQHKALETFSLLWR